MSIIVINRYHQLIYVFIIFIATNASLVLCVNVEEEEGEVVVGKQSERYPVAALNFEYVSSFLLITLWILLGSLAKVGFNLHKKLTKTVPESCLLILMGLLIGGLLYSTKITDQKPFSLPSNVLFLLLLPPIILEAGYFMPNRPFFNNIGTILLLAIVNTLFNAIFIGLTLWAFTFMPSIYNGVNFNLIECFIFASAVSATDPVAVIVTFLEVNVNDMLYIIVFGEALLNDGVSAVLYRLCGSFASMGVENIQPVDALLGFVSFFIVSLGSVLVGVAFGAVASFTTKYTKNTPILEPLIILAYAYLSYLIAELLSLSGILAITFCGMFMKQFVELNIDKRSNSTVEYVIKMLASIMETIIFMFMGLSTISDQHAWNTGFIVVAIVACFVYRVLGIFLFTVIANQCRLHRLNVSDMVVLSYSGIRGGIAFTLASILDEEKIPRKNELVTATIAVVFFTVFIQGATIGPLVRYLRIKQQESEETTMSAKLTNRLIDHVMCAFEDITAVGGNYALRDRVRKLDRQVLKKALVRDQVTCRDENLMKKFKKVKEAHLNKLAEDTSFTIPTPHTSIFKFLSHRHESAPDFHIMNIRPSKRNDEDAKFHYLLDTAMFAPRRNVTTVHRTEHHSLEHLPRYQRPIYPYQRIIHNRNLKKSNTEVLPPAPAADTDHTFILPPPWKVRI